MYKTCHLFCTYFFHNGTDSVCSRNFDFYATSSSLNKFSSEPNKLFENLYLTSKKAPMCTPYLGKGTNIKRIRKGKLGLLE